MFLFNLLFLLIPSVSLTTDDVVIDCTIEGTCFGEPLNCHPNSNCTTLFHFDLYGNLHLFLKNLTDTPSYAAFPIQTLPDETIEYLICIPLQSKRYRVVSELGELIEIKDQILTGGVEKISESYYRCIFNAEELPERFQEEQHFFVTRGIFDEEVLIIYDGLQLYHLEHLVDYQEDLVEYEDDAVFKNKNPGPDITETPLEKSRIKNGQVLKRSSHYTKGVRKVSVESDEIEAMNEEDEEIKEKNHRSGRHHNKNNPTSHRMNKNVRRQNQKQKDYVPRRGQNLDEFEEEEHFVPRRRDKNRLSTDRGEIQNEEEEQFLPRRRDKNRDSREDADVREEIYDVPEENRQIYEQEKGVKSRRSQESHKRTFSQLYKNNNSANMSFTSAFLTALFKLIF
uniref:Uncharacterized protein n=1 Tax=Caenorhabditis tropicalis TaxID=1561998 RepID=A0A1I7TN98_9PELO